MGPVGGGFKPVSGRSPEDDRLESRVIERGVAPSPDLGERRETLRSRAPVQQLMSGGGAAHAESGSRAGRNGRSAAPPGSRCCVPDRRGNSGEPLGVETPRHDGWAERLRQIGTPSGAAEPQEIAAPCPKLLQTCCCSMFARALPSHRVVFSGGQVYDRRRPRLSLLI